MKIFNGRLLLILVLFALAFAGMRSAHSAKVIPIKKSLALFPHRIATWEFSGAQALSDTVVNMLGVDDYIDYTYRAPDGQSLHLYVSYFSSVGTTGGYHSPRNCLPGGGWQIVALETLPLLPASCAGPVKINAMIVQNGPTKLMALYWFQNRGRIIASEYWDKIYLVNDALFKQRRDGAFVRIMAPLTAGAGEETARRLQDFAAAVIDVLAEYIPGKEI